MLGGIDGARQPTTSVRCVVGRSVFFSFAAGAGMLWSSGSAIVPMAPVHAGASRLRRAELDWPLSNLILGFAGSFGEDWGWDVSFQEDVPAGRTRHRLHGRGRHLAALAVTRWRSTPAPRRSGPRGSCGRCSSGPSRARCRGSCDLGAAASRPGGRHRGGEAAACRLGPQLELLGRSSRTSLSTSTRRLAIRTRRGSPDSSAVDDPRGDSGSDGPG